MYWNELNPQKRNILFKFDDSDIKKDKDRILIKLKTNVFNFVNLFFSSSNIHGLNHLTDKRRHYIEKLIWVIAICLSIYGSAILGSSTWNRYQENPTVISMDREYKEWATALPAITLCPMNKIDDQLFNGFIQKKFSNYTDEEKEELWTFLMLLANATYGTFNEVPVYNRISPNDYLNYVLLLSSKLSYTIGNSHVDIFSSNELVPSVTELGLCYSYNGYIAPYNDYKYWIKRNISEFPKIDIISGTPLDGDVFVQITSMNFSYMGFVHSPYEVPDVACRIFPSQQNFYKILEVAALSIYSAPEIKYLSPRQRGCRFLDESDLEISPEMYTYNMCRNQCRMDQARKLCGCVPYFYRPLKKYKICDVKGMYCLDQHKEFLIKLRNTTGVDKKVNCGCYPPCNDVNYIVERDNTIQWYFGTDLKWGLIKYPRMRLKRNVLFGFTDVLVSIGGTAGLFFGCSVLSFLEIIYFFTFRLAFMFLHKK
ncbi:pickpocket protein 11-like [Melanaphis sacchari]|uniref:pickpocket protein 11-like n=1 Tax=Melanaphis sacchari TaxID=742174 RepID=UPI000DC14BD4|nr:pickpocket protein 11-like [Melanaphis sacchari]